MISIRIGFILFTLLVAGCVTSKSTGANDGIELRYIGKFQKPDGDYSATIAKLDLANSASTPLCVMEDIFINDLSPFVSIEENSRKQRSSSTIPHPPISNQISRIEPGRTRSFERIIGYSGQGRTLAPEIRVTVEISLCQNPRRIYKAITIRTG